MMRRIETIIFVCLFAFLNLTLLKGGFTDTLAYIPAQVAHGQFYRLLTHPFVHISVYHLLLDGAAFLLLYNQLNEKSLIVRLIYLLGIHVAVTIGVTLSLPHISATSYCGISGVAHGLLTIWCLERSTVKAVTREQKIERLIAIIILIGLIAKCTYEMLSGRVYFESMHLGNVGIPVVASHMAGLIGAVMIYTIINGVSGYMTASNKRQAALCANIR